MASPSAGDWKLAWAKIQRFPVGIEQIGVDSLDAKRYKKTLTGGFLEILGKPKGIERH